MSFTKRLNASNFSIYATKMYNNPDKMTTKELNKDLKRFSYIGKLLKRYYNNKQIGLQLLVNHFVIINNLFGSVPAARLLFFYYDDFFHPSIKTILYFLNIEYGNIPEVNVKKTPMDMDLLEELQAL